MNILLIHRSFPSQLKYPALVLGKDPNNLIMFITNDTINQMEGVNKLVYQVTKMKSPDGLMSLTDYEDAIFHGESAATLATQIKQQGIIPDIIIGHSWGPTLFVKEIFPDTPFIGYFEWYNKYEGSLADFGRTPSLAEKAGIKLSNSHILHDLCDCDAGISPTYWQKSQIPEEFQDKIEVIFDGVDTAFYKPEKNVKFTVPNSNLELSAEDEVITYATRGMEPSRGFPQFMEAVSKLQKMRPNAQFLIAGNDEVCYGGKHEKYSHKKEMLEKFNLDLSRIHFVGTLPYYDYIKLLQISSVHVYLTKPFFLSWSCVEAMSTGCCIVASSTPPVKEVITDNYNGLLVDFFDTDELAEKVVYALENKDKMQQIRENARQTILEKYDIKLTLPKHYDIINRVVAAHKNKTK